MSMTDTRAAFEYWFSDEGAHPKAIERSNSGGYILAAASSAWNVWQAATEAAKATGTALQPMTMSYVQNVPDQCDRITWRGAYYHLNLSAQPTLAATQAGDAWISVGERLPDMHTEVMVWPHPSDYIMTAEVDRKGVWSYNEYCSNWGNENVKLAQGRITHWMPLPSSPTTDKKG